MMLSALDIVCWGKFIMIIAHNMLAMNGNRQLGINNRKAARSAERLGSGYRVNRSYIGAKQNRLEHSIRNSDNASENLQAAESLIRDANMADEMVELSKDNILMQVGQSILAQSNQASQGVLNLLK